MLEMGNHRREISSSEYLGHLNGSTPVLIEIVNRSIVQIFNRSLEPKEQPIEGVSKVPHLGTFKNQHAMLSAAKGYIHDSLKSQGITFKKKMRTSFDTLESIYKKYSNDMEDTGKTNEQKRKGILTTFRARMESGAVAEDIVSCLLIMHIFGSQGALGLPWTVEILFDDNSAMSKFTEGNRHADRALRQILRTAKILLPQIYPENPAILQVFQDYVNGLMQKILDREFIDFSGRFDILESTSTGAANTRDAHERKGKPE